MSLGNTFENDLLKLIFQGVAIANLADNAATAPATNIYVSLHTADPGEGGDQTTNETAYTNYARIAVARTSGGWSVPANIASNVAEVLFAQCGATPGAAITHAGVGMSSSGAGKLLASGALGSSLTLVANQTQPRFPAGTLTLTLD